MATAVRSFVTPANGVADDSLIAFRLGTGSGTAAQQTAGGELALAPAGGSEFLQPQLPGSMSASPVAAGGNWQVMAGELRADGARVQLRPGRRQLAVVRRDLRPAVGPVGRLGLGLGRSVGRHRDPVRRPGRGDHGCRRPGDRRRRCRPVWPGRSTSSRIDRTGSTVTYRVDGAVVARHQLAAGALTATVEDSRADGIQLAVDWIRLAPAVGPGTFTSRILDAQQMVTWRIGDPAGRPAGGYGA